MNKLQVLNEVYDQEVHNLMCYSKNYLMEEPKEQYENEWAESKEKVILLEQIMDEIRSNIKTNEQVLNKIIVENKDQLDELYNSSALTLIGLENSDESINQFIDWIKKYSEVSNPLNVYIISGSTMNKQYNLTGNNRYNDDLTIVSIKNQDIKQLMRVVIPRFEIGGRWFDDIVNNNAWREEEKQETEEFE
ncbi:MAG: hypothetical protein ACI4VP_06515 [Clostridia bacterium]